MVRATTVRQRVSLSMLRLLLAFSFALAMVACGGVSHSSNSTGGSGTTGGSGGSSGGSGGSGSGGSGSGGTGNSGGSGGTAPGGSGGGGTGSGGGSGGTGGTSTPTFVYVSANESNGSGQIVGFSIGADGSTTATPGSPFVAHSKAIAADPQGHFLFGADDANITTYTVGSNGALTQASNLALTSNAPSGNLDTDVSGQNLYFTQFAFEANSYLEFSVASSGTLKEIGSSPTNMFYGSELTFSHDNAHAYNHGCQMTGQFVNTLNRQRDGALVPENAGIPTFSDSTATFFCPVSLSTSPSQNIMAVAFAGNNGVLGVYSIASDGSGKAIGTPVMLPAYMQGATTSVMSVTWDNTGNYVAISTVAGVQVYKFDSTSGLTAVGQAQGGTGIHDIQFDKQGHLIGLSPDNKSLLIFNFTNGTLKPAADSPHALGFTATGVAAVPQQTTSLGTGS